MFNFILLTASSGWGRGDFMMRTCSWVRTDLSDRSDWTFQYKNEHVNCDDYKWYYDVDDDNRVNYIISKVNNSKEPGLRERFQTKNVFEIILTCF